MPHYLSDEELKRTAPAELASFRSPIPTQIVSNGEFNPLPQTRDQARVEARIKELAAGLGKKHGMSRRRFLASSAGMAAAFLAMNEVFGPVFDVSPAEASSPGVADLRTSALAGQFIIEWSINHSTWISGGVQSTIYVPTPTFFGWQINSEYRRYFMVLPVAIVAYVAALNLVRSRVGRAFIAVRDRDVAAEIIGVDIFRYKLLAFAVSSFYAGMAGALWTYYLKIANYEHFTLATSVSYLAMIIIGGLGSVLGSVFGAVFITLLPIVLVYVVEGGAALLGFKYAAIADFLANLRLITFGGLIILFLAIEPEGLFRMWGNVKRYFRLWPYSY